MRIRVPVAVAEPGAAVSVETLCPPERHGGHLQDAAIDLRRTGRPYRYLYANYVLGARPCNSVNAICRVDVIEGTVMTWHDSPNAIAAGAPTFLPRPGADPEDETDGVLLVDYLASDGHGIFVVLGGRSLTEVARVVLPYRHCKAHGSTWFWGPQIS